MAAPATSNPLSTPGSDSDAPRVRPSSRTCPARSPSTACAARCMANTSAWPATSVTTTSAGILANRKRCRLGTTTRLVWIWPVAYSEVMDRAPSAAITKKATGSPVPSPAPMLSNTSRSSPVWLSKPLVTMNITPAQSSTDSVEKASRYRGDLSERSFSHSETITWVIRRPFPRRIRRFPRSTP
jgi:hypothetical protein